MGWATWSFAFLFGVLGVLLVLLVLLGTVGEDASFEWTEFLGRFHPVVLHLPIGALAVVALMEIWRLCSRGRWPVDVVPALGFAALSGVIAVFSGFLLGQDSGYGEELLNEHFWWGAGFGAVTCVALVLKLLGRRFAWARFGYALALLGSLAAMTWAGHLGASLTHGETYLTDKMPASLREALGLPEKQKSVAEQASEERSKPLAEQNFYVAHIMPVLDSKCYACHNNEKQKGQLNMLGLAKMLEGGKEGPILVPGNAPESPMIERIKLPDYDEKHMPPTGKPQVNDYELALLEFWVNSGAAIDQPVLALEPPSELLQQMEMPLGEATADQHAVAKMLPPEDYRELLNEVTVMQERFPGAILLRSRSGDALSFNATALTEFEPDDLEALAPFAGRWVEMNLSGSSLSDEDLAGLSEFSRLKSLRLNHQPIESEAIRHLENLKVLESLSLYGTLVDDSVLEPLLQLPALKRVYLSQTQMTEAGVEKLSDARDLEIIFEATP